MQFMNLDVKNYRPGARTTSIHAPAQWSNVFSAETTATHENEDGMRRRGGRLARVCALLEACCKPD